MIFFQFTWYTDPLIQWIHPSSLHITGTCFLFVSVKEDEKLVLRYHGVLFSDTDFIWIWVEDEHQAKRDHGLENQKENSIQFYKWVN